MKFYRYEEYTTTLGTDVQLKEFRLVKETPKGYWIRYPWDRDAQFDKWVSKNGKKRFAYPTEEEAKVNFIARKRRQIKILETQISIAKSALRKMGEEA